MKISVQKLTKSQIELRIEVPIEEFNDFIEKAALDLGKDLEVEGFRKGKAPKEIIEREVGLGQILSKAAELAIEENYQKAILEKKIEAISPPKIEILKLARGNPFEFKAKTQVLPEIELPDYKKIVSQVQKREVAVTKEEIERLKAEKKRLEKERVRQEILEKIAQNTKAEIPEILIAKEKRRILENLKRGVSQVLQISFKDYLTKLKKTEKEMLDSFESEAQKRVKTSLVLREIGKQEKIEVSSQEIEKELKMISKQTPDIENQLDSAKLKDYTKEALKNEKTFQFLESFIKN